MKSVGIYDTQQYVCYIIINIVFNLSTTTHKWNKILPCFILLYTQVQKNPLIGELKNNKITIII